MEEIQIGHRLLDVIRILSIKGESGRLQIRVGETGGAFFFKKGKLVDARMGPLTGFPAVNAAVSIREARFTFDPSIPPPTSRFNTLHERTVLKELFGIETVDPEASNDQVSVIGGEPTFTCPRETSVSHATDLEWSASDPQNGAHKQTQVERRIEAEQELEKVEEAEGLAKRKATVEAQRIADEFCELINQEARKKLEGKISYPLPSSRSSYRRSLYLAILLVLLGAGAVALVQELNEGGSPTSAAKPSESSLPLSTQDSQFAQKGSAPQNLTGQWKLVNIIEKTSYRSFTHLEIGFRLQISQTGTDFTAKGEKVSENGRILPAAGRTPIHLTGSIDGERIEATFIEEGLRRKTSGRFVWRIENAGAGLSGTFVSTAARTSGRSAATKEL